MKQWKTLSKKTIFKSGKHVSVEQRRIELPDGRVIPDWQWIITPDYVNVVAVTDDRKFLCFRQTKYAVKGTSLAPIGGYIEKGERPLAAAKRELLEETGFKAKQWIALGNYPVDANRGAGNANFFLAVGARRVADPNKDDLEEQELLFLSFRKIVNALKRHEFKVLSWAMAVLLAVTYLERNR